MRTTVTIDDDVFALLSKAVRKSGTPFRQAVNHYLRLGLATGQPKARPFKVTPQPLGLPAGMSYDNISQLLDQLDGPAHL